MKKENKRIYFIECDLQAIEAAEDRIKEIINVTFHTKADFGVEFYSNATIIAVETFDSELMTQF